MIGQTCHTCSNTVSCIVLHSHPSSNTVSISSSIITSHAHKYALLIIIVTAGVLQELLCCLLHLYPLFEPSVGLAKVLLASQSGWRLRLILAHDVVDVFKSNGRDLFIVDIWKRTGPPHTTSFCMRERVFRTNRCQFINHLERNLKQQILMNYAN